MLGGGRRPGQELLEILFGLGVLTEQQITEAAPAVRRDVIGVLAQVAGAVGEDVGRVALEVVGEDARDRG